MPRRGCRHRVARGIFRDSSGYAVRVEVLKHREEKRFPITADLQAMKDWQAERRVELRRLHKTRTSEPGTFERDAERYLAAVKGMPSFVMREADIDRWVREFRSRRRDTITTAEIAAVLHRWFTDPRAKGKPPYAANTVNHRRTALLHLFTLLDGPTAQNPVRAVKKFRPPDPQPRGYDYPTIRRILSKMTGKGLARASVLAYTGLPPKQVMEIESEHVNWQASRVLVQGRRKGAGTKARSYPLTPEGVAAFRLLDREGAWGKYSTSSLRKAWRRACVAAGAPIGRPYDLRHSFAAATYAVSDQRAAQELLDHRDPRTSDRYIMAAISGHVSAALPKLAALQRAPRRGRTGTPKRGTEAKSP